MYNICEKKFRLEVKTGGYLFVPHSGQKEEFTAENVIGFYTANVRECIVLFIKGKDGYALAHYHRTRDPKDLKNKIIRDFPNGNLIIQLIGGNFENGFLPWSPTNRKIIFNGKNSLENNMEVKEAIQKVYAENSNWACFFQLSQDYKNFLSSLRPCIKKNKITHKKMIDFYSFHNQIKKEINKTAFDSMNVTNQFTIETGVDFVPYQNYCSILDALDGVIENGREIKYLSHFFNKPGTSVIINLLNSLFLRECPKGETFISSDDNFSEELQPKQLWSISSFENSLTLKEMQKKNEQKTKLNVQSPAFNM